MITAVPVSWHMGSTPPAAMLAFCSNSVATKRSLSEASGSSRMLWSCWRWPGAQVVVDVVHGDRRQQRQCPGLDLQERSARSIDGGDALGGYQPVVGGVRAERQQIRVSEGCDVGRFSHADCPHPSSPLPVSGSRGRSREGARILPVADHWALPFCELRDGLRDGPPLRGVPALGGCGDRSVLGARTRSRAGCRCRARRARAGRGRRRSGSPGRTGRGSAGHRRARR